MDNTLVYETGDCGSIPYVGAKKTVDNYCKRLYNRNLNTKEVMTWNVQVNDSVILDPRMVLDGT